MRRKPARQYPPHPPSDETHETHMHDPPIEAVTHMPICASPLDFFTCKGVDSPIKLSQVYRGGEP